MVQQRLFAALELLPFDVGLDARELGWVALVIDQRAVLYLLARSRTVASGSLASAF